MKPNYLIIKKQKECARRGHGPTIQGPGGISQCTLCGRRFAPGENSEVMKKGDSRFTEEELEALKQIKRKP